MTDKLTPEERSILMSKIRSKNTKPELIVRRFLFSKGLRYRIHDSRYPGSPDIVLPRYKTVILVNGCFWHGHKNCWTAHIPESNSQYLEKKIRRNIERDKENLMLLKKTGWKVIVIWECQLNKKLSRERELDLLIKKLTD